MGFFTTPKPHISQREFRDLINELYSSGEWSERERQQINMMFGPFLNNRSLPDEPGITAEEIKSVLSQMRKPENIRIHGISEHKIQVLEGEFKKFLGKNY